MVRRHAPNATIRRFKGRGKRKKLENKEQERGGERQAEKKKKYEDKLYHMASRMNSLFAPPDLRSFCTVYSYRQEKDCKFIINQNGKFIDGCTNDDRPQKQRMQSFREKQVLNKRSIQEKKGAASPTLAQEVKHIFCRLYFTDYGGIYEQI